MPSVTQTIIRDATAFNAMREEWDALLAQSPDRNLFLSWEWLDAWWQSYGADYRLNILAYYDQGDLCGLVPLLRSCYRFGGVNLELLENISFTDTDRAGIIFKSEAGDAVVKALMDYLAAEFDRGVTALRLRQLPAESRFMELLRAEIAGRTRLNWWETPASPAPYLALPDSWDTFFYSMRKKRRNNLRRSLKVLEAEHRVEFSLLMQADPMALDEFIDLHQRRWREQGFPGVFATAAARRHYTEAAQGFAAQGWLALSLMRVDRAAVSAVYGASYGGSFHYILTGFDSRYAAYSAGNLHIMWLIEQAIKTGCREFDFLAGDTAYKRFWTSDARHSSHLLLYPAGFRSRVRLGLFRLALQWLRLRRFSPAVLWRFYRRRRESSRRERDSE